MYMLSVKENKYTCIIKNSKFICLIYPIFSLTEVETYLNQAKIDYPDATHYCYCYILNQERKESDDGEPSGTAGMPMLQVLEKNNLNHVLCIIIRYFGKIKLGANGLIRAYSGCVTNCIKEHIIELIDAYVITITFPYSILKKIDYILKNSKIILKEFHDMVIYQAIIPIDLYDVLCQTNPDISIKILKKTFISSSYL